MNIDNLQSEEVEKKWGKEIIVVNNDKYCGKILCLKKGKKFSMHYHMIKDETWYVSSGELILKWIDTSSAIQNEKRIKKGDVVRIVPGLPHQLIACIDSEIFEISTTHYDNDSYRIFKGDSQL